MVLVSQRVGFTAHAPLWHVLQFILSRRAQLDDDDVKMMGEVSLAFGVGLNVEEVVV